MAAGVAGQRVMQGIAGDRACDQELVGLDGGDGGNGASAPSVREASPDSGSAGAWLRNSLHFLATEADAELSGDPELISRSDVAALVGTPDKTKMQSPDSVPQGEAAIEGMSIVGELPGDPSPGCCKCQ
jgi:hypothetical protein